MQTGLDGLLRDEGRLSRLRGRRVAILANPASMTSVHLGFQHALDALVAALGQSVTAAFGPQHGMRGDGQSNMEESPTYSDPRHGIPVFSLYGDVRRPTREMLDHFDVVLVNLQDVGWRGYTWVATLLFMLQACAKAGKAVWVLDRPIRGPDGRGQKARGRTGELCRRGSHPAAAWAHARRDGALHGRPLCARHRSRRRRHGALFPGRGPGFWLAPGHGLDQSEPGDRQSQLRPMYHGHGVARRNQSLRRPGHDNSAGSDWGARLDGGIAPGAHESDGPRVLQAVSHLRPCFFEPFFDQSTRATLRGRADPRGFSRVHSGQLPTVPAHLRALQVPASGSARLRVVA